MMTSNSLGKLCLLAVSNVPDLVKEMLTEPSCAEELGANDEKKKKEKKRKKKSKNTYKHKKLGNYFKSARWI